MSHFNGTNNNMAGKDVNTMKIAPKVWRNGEFIDWSDANIHIMSHVVNYGSSVFEGIRCYDTSKGPAVRALRAQTDKRLYEDWMKHTLVNTPGLFVVQGEVSGLDVSRETIRGVRLADGRKISARAVVLATGTFLQGRVVVGQRSYAAGRVGELPATRLSAALLELGLQLDRFQSATPPRIDGRTVDVTKMVEQPGDLSLPGFSHWERPQPRRQLRPRLILPEFLSILGVGRPRSTGIRPERRQPPSSKARSWGGSDMPTGT